MYVEMGSTYNPIFNYKLPVMTKLIVANTASTPCRIPECILFVSHSSFYSKDTHSRNHYH